MAAAAILAIDQGTTNTKVVLIDKAGEIVTRANRTVALAHPQPGWAEQSAEEIWQSVVAAIAEAVAAAPGYEIDAVAISAQRETVVLWDAATGRPIGPAISWQCRRSSDACAGLRAAGHAPMIVERTGLAVDPLFSATKLAWLLQHLPGMQDPATLRAGTIDSWLLWNLTAGAVHATDMGNASRMQLFDLHRLQWDAELAALFGVPLDLLPKVRASDSMFGTVAAGRTALPAGVPIHAIMADSHAALFAHGVQGSGEVKATLGTGSSIMTRTDRPPLSRHGLSGTIAWSCGDRVVYALEGNVTVSGQVAAFTSAMLGLADAAALTTLAGTVGDSDGVIFVPALAGLGAPHWQDRARGIVTGLTLRSRSAHLAHAALDAIAMQIADVFAAMEADLGRELPSLSVDGGASRSDLLLQILADLLGRQVTRLESAEASAFGVARMAADALGWSAPRARPTAQGDLFAPKLSAGAREARRLSWATALRRADPDL